MGFSGKREHSGRDRKGRGELQKSQGKLKVETLRDFFGNGHGGWWVGGVGHGRC